jgi:hypothetical protein
LALLPVVVVIGALLVVVVGQALLASGQVRLAGIQQKLNVAQGVHRQIELQVSQLETPSRIVGAALGAGMVHPTKVNQLPYVSLSTPLPTPAVTPVPAATTPTTAATTTPTTAATTTPTTAATTTPTTAATTTPTTTAGQ